MVTTLGESEGTDPSLFQEQALQVFESDPDSPLEIAMTPVTSVYLDPPEAPGCCRYRDFARGVVEPVWNDPSPSSRELATTLAYFPESKDVEFAHSVLSSGPISSLRIDYGFLSTVSGRARPVQVAGLLS